MKHETTSLETVEERLRNGDSIDAILADSEYQTNWTNHWDVNPDGHGGCFVRFDGSHWEVIVTTPPDHFPADVVPGDTADASGDWGEHSFHLFERFHMEPADIWDMSELRKAAENAPESLESDPYAGFTDDARGFADAYSSGGPDASIDIAAVKGLAMDFHGYYGAYHLNGRDSWIDASEYWEELDNYGVNTEGFK